MQRVGVVAVLGVVAFAAVAANFGALSAGTAGAGGPVDPREPTEGGAGGAAVAGGGSETPPPCEDCARPDTAGLLSLLPDAPWSTVAGAVGISLLLAVWWWFRRGPTDGGPPSASDEPDPSASGDGSEPRWSVPSPPPRNRVEAAWRALRERAGADDTRSPEEVSRAATRRGLDPESVAAVTALFRRVRYGEADATAARERRAEDARRAFATDPPAAGADPSEPHEGAPDARGGED